MRVAVLGAGSIGFGVAALLCERGHDPGIWSPSGAGIAALGATQPLMATGRVTGSFRLRTAANLAGVLSGAEAAIIAVPGYAHRAVIDAVVPLLGPEQTIIISSHMSMSALYLSMRLEQRGLRPPIVAWGTTIVTGRKTAPTEVRVSNIRSRVDIATLPETQAEGGLAICETLFGKRFMPLPGLVAVSLSNLNPQNHLAIALCNFTRIELGEAWRNFAGVTESVGRLMERLDGERLALAAAYGCAVRTIKEHFELSFGVAGDTIAAMARAIAQHDATAGPTSIATRYVTEDVPFGLVTTQRLARLAGMAVPLHESGIRIFSALYGRDFVTENNLLPELGLERITLAALERAARVGWRGVKDA